MEKKNVQMRKRPFSAPLHTVQNSTNQNAVYIVAMQYHFIIPVTTILPKTAVNHVTQYKKLVPANNVLFRGNALLNQ